MKRSRVAVGIAAALLASAAAAEVEYGVEVGIGNSDNIARSPDNEESETILTTGLDLRWLREDGLLTADVNVDLSYFDYQDDSYDSEVTGIADADLRLRFMPDRFEWVIADSFGQAETDPFVASTPDTLENVNFFSTGPDFTFRLGSAASVTMFGRYSMSTYEESNFDDERTMGGLSIGRDLSQRSNVSLNATTERVEYDDPLVGSNFDRQSYYLRYEVDGARTRIGAEAGYSEVHDGGDANSSPLVELTIARDLSPRSVLTFSGGVRSSDTSSALGVDDVFGGGPTRPERISTTDTFEMNSARVAWEFSGPRTTFVTSVGFEDNQYDNATELDRKRTELNFMARRQVTPRFSIEGQAMLFKSEFDESGQDDDEMQVGIHTSWNAVGRLFIEFDVDYYDRNSTVDTTEYQETRAFLRFAWRSTGERTGAR